MQGNETQYNAMQCKVLFVCMHMQCEDGIDPYCWDGLQTPVDVSLHFFNRRWRQMLRV